MEVGSKVKITDGSYAVRVDQYENYAFIGLSTAVFEVVQKIKHENLTSGKCKIHDIIIKNTKTGAMYLHSEAFVRVIETPTKELTMSQIEKHYGCKVKIIK